MDIMKLHVLQWSAHQRAFHEDTVEKMLEDNRRAMAGLTKNKHYDWVPVFLAEHADQLQDWKQRHDPRGAKPDDDDSHPT